MNLINFSKLSLVTLSLSIVCMDANAVMTIKPIPLDGHQHNRRAPKQFILTGYENSAVKYLTPDLQSKNIQTDKGHFALKPTGKDNYHVLVAKRQHNGVQESAVRYVYFNGKPTGHSPEEITSLQKSELEIIPDPLPREHWHYKAGEQVSFVVRFQGNPHASLPVTLATNHASILKAVTDSQGRVFFTLPNDFMNIKAGRNANKPGALLLHTKLEEQGQTYATWLSADYQVNPEHWQNRTLGGLVATGGFIFGAFITGLGFKRRDEKDKK